MATRVTGRQGEDAAARFLESLGWHILDRNIHYRVGEVDLLADSGKEIVLVEVKVKRSYSQGAAVEMLTWSKQRTLRQLAKHVQVTYNKPVRIDVITIDNFGTPKQTLQHYPYAVGE